MRVVNMAPVIIAANTTHHHGGGQVSGRDAVAVLGMFVVMIAVGALLVLIDEWWRNRK